MYSAVLSCSGAHTLGCVPRFIFHVGHGGIKDVGVRLREEILMGSWIGDEKRARCQSGKSVALYTALNMVTIPY